MPQSLMTAWLQKPSAASITTTVPTAETRTATSPTHNLPASPASSSEQPTSSPALPSTITLRRCTATDIPPLKRLTNLLLPIPYSETFFRETHSDPTINALTLLAHFHNPPSPPLLIGAIRCRLLTPPTDPPTLYLSTLVLLSAHRGHGIATALLRVVTRTAIEEYGVTRVGAHVWEANPEALEWYAKRGFVVVRREEGYYRRLKPSGAVVVQREVKVSDLLPVGGSWGEGEG